ncbi:hypothetical protein I7I50_12040 [Histoplasma capsulatum G186AR]|nr:hypothetical protein I7I50_12040 [Histoplasma capsulatum G186AR]
MLTSRSLRESTCFLSLILNSSAFAGLALRFNMAPPARDTEDKTKENSELAVSFRRQERSCPGRGFVVREIGNRFCRWHEIETSA